MLVAHRTPADESLGGGLLISLDEYEVRSGDGLLDACFSLLYLTQCLVAVPSSMDARGLYALYTQATGQVLVLVVNPFNNKEVTSTQLERQFRDAVKNAATPPPGISDLTFKVQQLNCNPMVVLKRNRRHKSVPVKQLMKVF